MNRSVGGAVHSGNHNILATWRMRGVPKILHAWLHDQYLYARSLTLYMIMRDGLNMCLQVIIHPNSAFAAIRDNDRKYFQFSIGIVLSLVILPNALIPVLSVVIFPGAFDTTSYVVAYSVAASLGLNALSAIAYAGVIYLSGRVWGGNFNWRKVFTVIFYTYVIEIPAVFVVVTLGLLNIPLGLYMITPTLAATVAVVVWMVVITIKAIKVVNGFGTAKAFGIIVLAFMGSAALTVPLSITANQMLFPALIENVSMWEMIAG